VSEPENPHLDRPLRSFGRIKARPIKPRQAALMDTLLPAIAVPDPKAGPLDPAAMMPGATETWLEIGFGGGEHMAAQAARRPDALVIGCEPFLNGVASALRHVDEMGLKNVRLHADDARDVVDALPDGSVDRILILFPAGGQGPAAALRAQERGRRRPAGQPNLGVPPCGDRVLSSPLPAPT
jgi:tRNA (guanine-N7-)-methyltransferase